MEKAIFLFIVGIVALSTPSYGLVRSYDYSAILFNDTKTTFIMHWSLNSTAVQIGLEGNGGWIAIGLSPDGLMPQSDIVMGYWNNVTAAPLLGDYKSISNSQPGFDTIQNWVLVAGKKNGTNFIGELEFDRLLNTGDSVNDTVIDPLALTWVLWGFRNASNSTPSNQINGWLQHTRMGSIQVRFYANATGPSAPQSLRLVSKTNSTISVAWDAPASTGDAPLQSYVLQRNLGSGWSTIYSGANTNFTFTGLLPGTPVSFRVAAVTIVGTGNYSSTLDVTTLTSAPGVCDPPQLVAAGLYFLHVSWSQPNVTGGLTLTYHLQMDDGANGAFSEIYTGSLTFFNATGLENTTVYRFQLAAENVNGTGPFSSIASYQTNSPIVTVPSAPHAPSVTGVTSSTVSLSWTPGYNGGSQILSYVLEMAQGQGSWQQVYNSSASTYTVPGLTKVTQYQFRVAAINAKGQGNFSTATNATTAPSVPGQMKTPVLVSSTSNSVTFKWEAPSDTGGVAIQGYTVTQLLSGYNSSVYSGSATQYTQLGLTTGVYSFVVEAYNSVGTGAASPAATYPTAGYFAPMITTNEFPNRKVYLDGRYHLYWKAVDSQDQLPSDPANAVNLVIGIEANGTGWVGWGLGTGMSGADMVIGTVVGSNITVVDYWSVGEQPPTTDTQRGGTDNILARNGQEVNGVTTIKWKKPLSTGDSQDKSIPSTQNKTNIVFAFQKVSDVLSDATAHLSNDMSSAVINIFQQGCPDNCSYPNGTCGADRQCDCADGFAGEDCSSLVHCTSNSDCLNNGTCVLETFQCSCISPYYGDQCEKVGLPLPGELDTSIYPFSGDLLGGNIKLYWRLLENDTIIEIALQADGTGWVGFGIGQGMTPSADIYTGAVSGSTVSFRDCWSTSTNQPRLDENIGGTDNVIAYNGSQANGKTVIKFRRYVEASDPYDKDMGSDTDGLVAYHSSSDNFGSEHGPNNRVTFKMNIYTGKIKEDKDWKRAVHGILMCFGWGFFIFLAFFVARFVKIFPFLQENNPWFEVHYVFNGLGLAMALAGFIIAIVMVPDDFLQSDKLACAHSWIGLITMILGFSQIPLGVISDRTYDPNRVNTPIWPDQFHWFMGRGAMVLAIVAIFTGFYTLDVAQRYINAWIIWLAFLFALFVPLNVWRVRRNYKKRKERIEMN